MTDRRLLLAGSLGPERVPARLERQSSDWFKPLHVQDPAAARDRIAVQIAIGADVVLAPTWRTHRRALLPLGETRQAQAWTQAALTVAREGVEAGIERRAEAEAELSAPESSQRRPRPLVAAALPALDDTPDPGGGRLLSQEAAGQRDYRDQAGILADTGPDLLLVEAQPDEAGTRVAMTEAADTGLPIWVALGARALATTELDDWIELARSLGILRLLLPPPMEERRAAFESGTDWGVFGLADSEPGAWLEAGATVVACLDGASEARLTRLRAALDDEESTQVARLQAAQQHWADHVAQTARMASGGAALWLGAEGEPWPAGFDWLQVEPSEVPQLPSDRFRLIIAPDDGIEVGRLLERGGLLARRGVEIEADASGLRLLSLDDQEDPPLVIYRREG